MVSAMKVRSVVVVVMYNTSFCYPVVYFNQFSSPTGCSMVYGLS